MTQTLTPPRRRSVPKPRPSRTWLASLAQKRPATTTPRREIRPGEAEESLALVSSALGIVALVCVWMLLQMLVLGGISEQRSQSVLYGKFRSQLAAATAPTGILDYNGKPVVPGAPVALLSIPRIDLSQVVVSGTASGDLLHGPGHLRNTLLPGQAGVSVVFGRAATYGAPFRRIADLKTGDKVSVQNAEGKTTYLVKDVRRAGDPVPAAPTGATAGQLTLVTAEGSGPLSALSPKRVIYVDAVTDQALPQGPIAGAVPTSEQAMARDTSALPVLVLLLAGLIALVLAVTIARRRFRPVLVWVLAVPVAIALAWSVTDQVMRLLPNLM